MGKERRFGLKEIDDDRQSSIRPSILPACLPTNLPFIIDLLSSRESKLQSRAMVVVVRVGNEKRKTRRDKNRKAIDWLGDMRWSNYRSINRIMKPAMNGVNEKSKCRSKISRSARFEIQNGLKTLKMTRQHRKEKWRISWNVKETMVEKNGVN